MRLHSERGRAFAHIPATRKHGSQCYFRSEHLTRITVTIKSLRLSSREYEEFEQYKGVK
jgi:hypothetical protein